MMFIKAFIAVIVSFLVIDGIWIAFVIRRLYENQVGGLLRDSPNMAAAGVFYLAYAAGIVFLAVRPAVAAASGSTALVHGAVLGAIAYGTFTVTNYSLLKGWTMSLVVSDILWGAVLTAACAWCGWWAVKSFG